MASSTLIETSAGRSRFKTVLWICLGLTTLFVIITSEVFLAADYPMYHAYRLQVIADRHFLIPHTICGLVALLAGPVQFSTRFRQRHLKIHRILGLRGCGFCRGGHGGRAGLRTAGTAGNLDAGRGVGGVHDGRIDHGAEPPDRPASAVDGALVRGDVHVCLQPRAESVAAVLEPSWRLSFGGRGDRLYPGIAAAC